MEKFLKNQVGSVVVMVIIVIIVSVVGGGATFLGVRMLVSGDGNFFQPFEDLGWFESKDDEEEKEETNTKGYSSKFKVDQSKLSDVAKESDTEHYYAEISMSEMMGDSYVDDEYSEMYDKVKMLMNVYVKDGIVIEVAVGFDISDICDYLYDYMKDLDDEGYLEDEGINSPDDLKEYMISYVEESLESGMDEASEYVEINSDASKGTIEIYMTKDALDSLFEDEDIDPENRTFDSFIENMNDSGVYVDFELVD